MNRLFSWVWMILFLSFAMLSCSEDEDDSSVDGDDSDGDEEPSDDDDDNNSDDDDDDDDVTDDDDDNDDNDGFVLVGDTEDATEDCTAQDASCLADLASLWAHYENHILTMRVQYKGDFPVEDGAFEIFFVARDIQKAGHTLRWNQGVLSFWSADCSSAAPGLKHSGCHWTTAEIPLGLSGEWADEATYELTIPLAGIDYDELDEVLLGVMAAPQTISVTADFTDRYPDELLVTSTAIEGLAGFSLAD